MKMKKISKVLLFILFLGCQQWAGAQIKNSSASRNDPNERGTRDKNAPNNIHVYLSMDYKYLNVIGLSGSSTIRIGNIVVTTQDSQIRIDISSLPKDIYWIYLNDIKTTTNFYKTF